jgi:hypothetical protein
MKPYPNGFTWNHICLRIEPSISKGIFYKIIFLGLGMGESPTYGLRLLGSMMILIFAILQEGPFAPQRIFVLQGQFCQSFLF